MDGVTLESPAGEFIKAVRIEGSANGEDWSALGEGQPVFRQPNGATQLHLSVRAGVWRWLRLTVDDRRSQPAPFTGARIDVVAGESAPSEWMPAAIAERHENPGATRLALNLGAANLDIAGVRIETDAPLFTRQVAMAVTQISEDSIRERTLARGVIFRVDVAGQAVSESLSAPLESQVCSRQLLLFVENGDSPPLSIRDVRVERRPVYLLFFAAKPGGFHLLAGNSHCSAPAYDLSALNIDRKSVPVSAIRLPPPGDNPDYRAPEVLPGIADTGTALDASAWRFRKPVKIVGAGAQQLELDMDVLAHSQPGFQDLRLLRGGRQIPFIVEHTSISRALQAAVTVTNDDKDSRLTRWTIQLPRPGLPLTRLSCTTRTPLFRRDVALWQEVEDERGARFRQTIAQGTWTQTPEHTNREFVLTLDAPSQGGRVFLETRNGDNPPIDLENFQLFYSVSRLFFKAATNDPVFLYYGNSKAAAPQYDLSLAGDQLVMADKTPAALSGEEQLKEAAWSENHKAGTGTVALWSVLALVVVALLAIIARLLPKASV